MFISNRCGRSVHEWQFRARERDLREWRLPTSAVRRVFGRVTLLAARSYRAGKKQCRAADPVGKARQVVGESPAQSAAAGAGQPLQWEFHASGRRVRPESSTSPHAQETRSSCRDSVWQKAKYLRPCRRDKVAQKANERSRPWRRSGKPGKRSCKALRLTPSKFDFLSRHSPPASALLRRLEAARSPCCRSLFQNKE